MTESSGAGTLSKAGELVKRIQNVGIDGVGPFKSAIEVAEECRTSCGGDVEKAVAKLVRVHVRLASTNGALTGLGGLVTLPLTIPVGMAGHYLVGARLAAGIAHLRGYDVHSEDVRTVVLLCLLGGAASEALKEVGIQIGTKSLASVVK